MSAKESNGSKATIREVYDLVNSNVIPMKIDIAEIKTTLHSFIKTYEIGHKDLEDKLDNCDKNLHNKISIKAFASWLTGAGLFITMVLALLKFFGVM